MKNILTISLIIFSALSAWAQEEILANFSPEEIRPHSATRYVITLKNIKAEINPSDIPLPDGLSIFGTGRSQNYSFINGKMSSSTTYTYTIVANSEGKFTIPEWTLKSGSNSFKVPQSVLNVSASAPASNTGAMQSPFGNPFFSQASSQQVQTHDYEDTLRSATKLELKLPREKIYVGETIKCNLVFSFDKSLLEKGYNITRLIPQIKNMDAFECQPFNTDGVVDKDSNPSKVFVTYSTVITPLKVGNYDIQFSAIGLLERDIPLDELMNMSIMDRMMSMGTGRRIKFETQMNPMKLDILPLPEENKPKNFTGAIGKFDIASETVSPDALSVGDPCTLTLKILGTGNFKRMAAPSFVETKAWKTSYKPKQSFIDEGNGNAYIGIKTFEYTIIPNVADITETPSIAFNYFDPTLGKYIEKLSKPLKISVAPTVRSKKAEAATTSNEGTKPALDAVAEVSETNSDINILNSIYFWIGNGVILALILIFTLRKTYRNKLESDPSYAKRIYYTSSAKNSLNKAHAQCSVQTCGKFFEAACEALRFALAANSELNAEALTLSDAKKIASELGLPPEKIEKITIYFEGADAIAYGGINAEFFDFKKLSTELDDIIKHINKRQ